MKKAIVYILSAAMLLAACVDNLQNEIDQPEESIGALITETITARVNEGDTKATIDDSYGFFSWVSSDRVAVHTTTDGYVVPTADPVIATTGTGSETVSTATFTISYSASGSRDAFAIYPSSIVAANATNYGQEGHTLDVTLPSTYTLAEVSGETSPCPMIAANTPGSGWEFKQLCGLLRLTVEGIPDGTTKLDIYFGRNVAGQFSIPSPVSAGSSAIAITNASGNNAMAISITGITTSEVTVNIPLPVGEYGDIIVTATNVSGGTYTLKAAVTTEGSAFSKFSLARKDGKKRSLKISELTSISHLVSSVAAGKYVIIAQSNLQATTTNNGSSWTWGFAENPWDYNGASYYSNQRISGNGTTSTNGTVDLFGWVGASNTTWEGALGTPLNAAMYGISNSTDNRSTSAYGNVSGEALKSDWGNTINDEYTWRTLTMGEWSYLLTSRASGSTVNGALINTSAGSTTGTVSNARYTLATINSVHGLIIFPNGATFEASEATWRYINNRIPSSYASTTWTDGTQCTTEQWTALAAKGCVFLPAAGERKGQSVNYASGEDNCGHYWTSTPNGDNQALFMRFVKTEGAATTSFNQERWYGLAVRLVREIN